MNAERRSSLFRLYTVLFWLGWICIAYAAALIIAREAGHEIGPGWLPLMSMVTGMAVRLLGQLGRMALTRSTRH
jgi:hypothetical protein